MVQLGLLIKKSNNVLDLINLELGGNYYFVLKAYKKWIQKNGGEKLAPGLGLTNDQMFFVSYAQVYNVISCINQG